MMFRSFTFATVILALAAQSTLAASAEDATCEPLKDPSCEGGAGGGQASLLQKVFKNEKTAFTHDHKKEEQHASDAQPEACTGISAQGKCWYLSELGETCSTTCAKYGKAFSYVVADTARPVTPKLVGHEPSSKQQPWAALECYVPSEDRFHTANANSAKHFEDDIGAWSHESCKLACPCSGVLKPEAEVTQCTWQKPAACAPKFEWKGNVYSGCAIVDMEHERPWCQHGYYHTEIKDAKDWSYCSYTCPEPQPTPTPPTKENCRWIPAFSCVKEYDYEGTHYVGCTATDNDTPWCSNTDPYKGSWNHCVYSCADKIAPREVVDEKDDVVCSWQSRPECQATFEYKGVEYSGCTTVDHPTPWCSHDSVHKGSWTTCQRVCTKPSRPTAPVPVPPTPATPTPVAPKPREEDPCERHPDAENDIIGSTVTLDEAGYKIAASADSPINMKRFVCRVVGKIECKVTDVSSLMAFVPYYSGLISQQTYSHLESELSTLCHAGGKWIVPLSSSYWNSP